MSAPGYVVMYSGGIQAWKAAKTLVGQGHRPTLLFTDTRDEDEDLYRFLDETVARFGLPYEYVVAEHHVEGLDIWDEFIRRKWIGNSRVAPCSVGLKQKPARKWVEENTDPASTTIVLGHDWTEINRTKTAASAYLPWKTLFPNCEPPYATKNDMLSECREWGVEPPALYKVGAPHNNCGGFCVRAGKGHMAWLLHTNPDRFWHHAKREQDARNLIGKDHSVFDDETLRELGERLNAGGQVDLFDIGGCGCFTESDLDPVKNPG